mmetsp:Transcript_20834/g.24618  ORF Transcript_20834/g.24618 Transcript_20834/m.24618 type:complete len:183 (-) Transcript_20834:93-641(-)
MSEIDRRAALHNRLRKKLEFNRRETEKRLREKEEQTKAKTAPNNESRRKAEEESNRIKMQEAIQFLQQKLDVKDSQKKEYKITSRSQLFESNKDQSSKANPSTFYTKQMPAHDKVAAANTHHTSSHYVMAASKSFQKNKQKGLVSRHSRQAAIRNGKARAANKQNSTNGVHNKKNKSVAVLM